MNLNTSVNLPTIAKKLPENVRALGVPPAISELGGDATFRFIEFFTAASEIKTPGRHMQELCGSFLPGVL